MYGGINHKSVMKYLHSQQLLVIQLTTKNNLLLHNQGRCILTYLACHSGWFPAGAKRHSLLCLAAV